MTKTTIPSMIVVDVDLHVPPSLLATQVDPMTCSHLWEPHIWETGKAHCPRCGSYARWVNDPRLEEKAS